MAITLITGLANAGKTGVVHELVRAHARTGGSPVLLLPSNPEVRRAAAEFARDKVIGIGVTQFDGYLDSRWGLLGDGRSIIGRIQRLILLETAVGASALAAIGHSASHPGFTRMLESVVRRAGETLSLDGHRAARVAANTPAHDILAVVDAYALLLQSGALVERSEAHRLLCAEPEVVAPGALIAINRFGSFTPVQLAFVAAAAAAGAEVVVALTWAEEHPATRAAGATASWLLGMPGTKHSHLASSIGASVDLSVLEEHLFSQSPKGCGAATPADIVFSEAGGVAGEAQRITSEVQELGLYGIATDEIAVIFRKPEKHVGAVRSAFREAGIAADFDVRVPLTSSGLGRSLVLLLRFLCRGSERSDLMGALRSGYLWAPSSEVDRFDEQSRRARVAAGRGLLTRAASISSRTASLLGCAKALSDTTSAQNSEGWHSLLADMMRSRYGATLLLDDDGIADAAAQKLIVTAIDEMKDLGESGLDVRVLLKVLEDSEITPGGGVRRAGHVQVMSAERARGRRFEGVVLGGLVAGEFPSIGSDDALTGTELASEMAVAGIDVGARSGSDDERMLFYQVVTGARKRLVLSRTIVDDDGQAMRSSSLWEELLDLYRDPVSGLTYDGGALHFRRLSLADLAESEDAPVAERRALRTQAARADGGHPRVALARRRARARAGCVSDEVAERLAEGRVYSASDIEAYLGCPYRWFYERVLRPETLDEAIDVMERGRAAHDIMRRFYEEWTALGHRRVTPGLLEKALVKHGAIARQVLDDGPAASTLLEEEVLRGAVLCSRRIVARDAEFLGGFYPEHFEWAFGRGDDAPEEIGSFFLKGAVDRIDVSERGIMIVDYKTGSQVTPRAKFTDAGLVQLPLYGIVASRRLGKPLLGGVYRSMQYGGDRGFYRGDQVEDQTLAKNDACDGEAFDTTIASAVAAAEEAVAGMRAGSIPARPRRDNVCDYCAARSVCERRQ